MEKSVKEQEGHRFSLFKEGVAFYEEELQAFLKPAGD